MLASGIKKTVQVIANTLHLKTNHKRELLTFCRRASKENYRFELLHLFSFFCRNSDKASGLSLYYTAKIFSPTIDSLKRIAVSQSTPFILILVLRHVFPDVLPAILFLNIIKSSSKLALQSPVCERHQNNCPRFAYSSGNNCYVINSLRAGYIINKSHI